MGPSLSTYFYLFYDLSRRIFSGSPAPADVQLVVTQERDFSITGMLSLEKSNWLHRWAPWEAHKNVFVQVGSSSAVLVCFTWFLNCVLYVLF